MRDGLGAGRKVAIEKGLGCTAFDYGPLVLFMTCPRAALRPTLPAGGDRTPKTGERPAADRLRATTCAPPPDPGHARCSQGNRRRPETLAARFTYLKRPFGDVRVCLVGDRGILPDARINDELRPASAGLDHRACALAPADQRPPSHLLLCSCRCSTSRNLF